MQNWLFWIIICYNPIIPVFFYVCYCNIISNIYTFNSFHFTYKLMFPYVEIKQWWWQQVVLCTILLYVCLYVCVNVFICMLYKEYVLISYCYCSFLVTSLSAIIFLFNIFVNYLILLLLFCVFASMCFY